MTATIDWTKYGHDADCNGTHYESVVEIRCAEHPQLNRNLSFICCHRSRTQVLRRRSFPDGSELVQTLTECRVLNQDGLFA